MREKLEDDLKIVKAFCKILNKIDPHQVNRETVSALTTRSILRILRVHDDPVHGFIGLGKGKDWDQTPWKFFLPTNPNRDDGYSIEMLRDHYQQIAESLEEVLKSDRPERVARIENQIRQTESLLNFLRDLLFEVKSKCLFRNI